MPLTINSKIKELMANEEARREVDKIAPGLTTHPQIGVAKNFTLAKCAKLLPDKLTPEIMQAIADMLARVTGTAEDEMATGNNVSAEAIYDFDEIIDRAGTNSVKYDTAQVINPLLPDDCIPMWIADMDFAVPIEIRNAMKARLDKKILGYSMPLDADYYSAVIDFMKRRHNLDINFDNIIFSSGVIPAMEVAVQRLTAEGDGIIINTPAYHPFDESVKKHGREAVYSPLINNNGHYEFDFDDFEAKAKVKSNTMFFLCNPHNPSGRCWTPAELKRIGDICFANNVFVFSDEIHFDIIRKTATHTPFATLFPNEKRLLTATAPSKTFNLAGNQLANILIPDMEIAQDWRMNMYCGMPNPLSLDACVAAYTQCDKWVDDMCAYVDDNLSYVADYLKKHLPLAKFTIPEGTYLCWIDMRAFKMSDADMKKKISKAGLFVEFADEFVANGEGFIRMNIACPREIVSRALKMLCESMGGTSEEIYKPVRTVEIGHIGKLKVGDTLKNFAVECVPSGKTGLLDLAQGQKTAYLFLRYYGCTVCRVDLHRLSESYVKFQQKGYNVVVALQSDASLLSAELRENPLPFNIIADPDGKLYKAFDILPASSKLKMLDAAAVKKVLDGAKLNYKHGKYEGEELQLPLTIVAEACGKLKYVRYGGSISDIPTPAKLMEIMDEK